MNSFSFSPFPAIVFGAGKLSELPGIVSGFGKNILIVTGRDSFDRTHKAATFYDDLHKSKITYSVCRIPEEPSPDIVDTAVDIYGDKGLNAVVSIGGGSVIDAGKAISAMLTIKDSVFHYLEGVGEKIHPGNKIPFIAIPTTSGTGSEATKNAVISKVGMGGFKKSLRHDNFIPDLAVIDPELMLDCPRGITAASGMDAFSQLLESYLSIKANLLTDALAFEGIVNIKKYLMKVCEESNNIEARSGMAFAAFLSGVTLANAGLGLVHGYASPLGGFFHIPHGVVCGTLMPVVNKLTIEKLLKENTNPVAVDKYRKLGILFSGQENRNTEYYLHYFADQLQRFVIELEIPTLGQYGVQSTDVEKIAKATNEKEHPVSFTLEEKIQILDERL